MATILIVDDRPMGFSATAKRIAVEVVVAPDEPRLYADSLKLSHIVNNLLGNAIKFTPPGGRITVDVQAVNGGSRLRIIDIGPSTAAEDLPSIFETFRQGRAAATAGEQSTGLGLAIVQQLVELHHGRIEVSNEQGRGTAVAVLLPLSPAAPGGCATELASETRHSKRDSPRRRHGYHPGH